jgi:hypothetical protein
MVDIFDEVLSERKRKNDFYGDIFDQVLSERQTQGGEQNNEQNQPQAYSDRNAGRESNQQIQPPVEVGVQAYGEPSSLYGGDQRQTSRQVSKDIFDQVLSERKGGELVERQQKDAVYGVQGQEEGEGLRGEVPSGNKEEVESVGVQPPDQGFFEKAKQAGVSAYKGLGTFASEAQQYAFDLAKQPLLANAATAEAVFGPNAFSDKIRKGVVEKGDQYFRDLVAGSKMTGDEAKSPLNQFMFGVGHMVGDLIPAVATGGATAEETAFVKATELPIWKTIGQKAINGMKDFSVPALISANTKIDEEKQAGKTDSEALASGMKSLIETEAGAAIPMQVSSGLDNIILRGASRILQSTPLAVAQSELAKVAGNVVSKESERTPTITENIISGNFDEAARDLAQVAPMGLLGVKGERAKPIKDAGLPATAAVIESEPINPRLETGAIADIQPPKFEEAPTKPISLEPITPEAPPLAEREAAPSLPKEEALPPVSVAGEAPAVEPTAEVEMIPTPGVLPGGKEPPTMAPKAEYEKGITELQRLRGEDKISLTDYQNVHSDVAKGVDPIEAAQRAENEYQAHKYAGSEMSKAVSSGEIPSGPKAAKLYDQKYNQRLNELKPAEAPAEAQPTIPSEEQVKETSGIPTLQRKPPIAETAVKAEEGVAQREGEGKEGQVAPLAAEAAKPEQVAVPEGARVAAAAYLAPDGKIYEGPDHIAAMEKAKEAEAITQEQIDAKQTPESRNTSEYGFKVTLPDGTTQYTTREVTGNIAKQSGQALVDKFVHGDKAHSNEMRLDEYNHLGEKRVSPQKFAQDPKAAVQEAIPDPTNEVLQKRQMTRPDAEALGITPKGTAQTNFLIDSVKSKVEEIGDAIKYRGKNIKDLRKAGVEDEANQHAAARIYVPVHVEELLGIVFGETKDINNMRPTMDILVKDDIVGGYEDIVKQVNDLEAEKAQSQAEGRPTKAIQNKIDSLSQRGRDIEEAHPIEQYKQEIENASPEIQGNIERWKRHVVPEMDSLYNELKNVDPATEREGRGWKFGARLNLLSKTEEEKMASYGDLDKPMPSTSVSNYRNPNVKRDKFMKKASFLGDYSTDPVAILTNSLASRWNEVTKIRFYKALEDKGVGKIVAAGEEAPAMLGGKEAVRLPITFPETDPQTGITRVVEQSLYVQKGLEDSVKKILDVDSRPQQNPLAKAFTGIQIIGVADATAHLKNLQNVTRNALGRDSAWADLTAKIPVLGQAQSVGEIANVAKEVASNSQKIRDEKAYLAKIGALRPSYPAEGIQRFLGTHQLLYDVDTATRIILNRRYDELIKRYGAVDTESSRRDFINQVGNYNRRLMGRWETRARDTGFSPFIVAGRAMNKYARKMITGDPGFQTDNMKGAIAARAAQMSGLIFATLMPSITNMFTTGTPFGREGTPIGAIDFGPNYDTDDGKRRTFDVFALTGLRRGLRQFGIDSAIDGARSGKDIRDIERDMANGFITTKMHPWIGPAIGLGQETLTGRRFDLRTGYSQRYEARKIEGYGQYAENFRIALKQLNPLLYGVGGKGVEWAMKDVGGIPYPAEERASKENIGLISKATGAPQMIGEIEGALEKPVMGAIGYKESPSEAIKLANSFGESVQFTPEQDQRFTYRMQIKNAIAKGDKNTARDIYQQGFNDGILTEADKKSIGRYIKYPEKIVQKVQLIKTADQAVRVFRVATPQEQDAISEIVARKIANSTTIIKGSPQEKKLIDTFFASAKPNTQIYEIAKMRKKK